MLKRLKAAAVAATLGFFALGAVPSAAKADEPYWQCVTFARMFSGINIFGDALTWWNQAQGRYDTGARPQTGSVRIVSLSTADVTFGCGMKQLGGTSNSSSGTA